MSPRLSINYKVQAVALIGVLGFIVYFALSIRSNLEYAHLFEELSQQDLQVMELTNKNNLIINQIESIAQSNPGKESLERLRRLQLELNKNMNALMALEQNQSKQLEDLAKLNQQYVSLLIGLAEGSMTKEQERRRLPMVQALAQDIVRLRDEYRVRHFEIIEEKILTSQQISQDSLRFGFIIGLALALIMLLLARYFSRGVTRTLKNVSAIAGKISKGEWDVEITTETSDETSDVLRAMEKMKNALQTRSREDELRQQKQKRLMALSDMSRGDLTTTDLCRNIMLKLPPMLEAQVGALYVLDNEDEEEKQLLKLIASYAFNSRKGLSNVFEFGQGVIGQVALERTQVVLSDLPPDYLSISSSLGQSSPAFIVVTPLVFDDHLFGVVELGFVNEPSAADVEFLNEASETIAQYLETSFAREQVKVMLDKTREQAEKLEQQQEILKAANEDLENQAMALTESESRLLSQQEELRVSNEELEEQAKALKLSEERLQAQQEELRVTNEELEEHTRALEQQKSEMKLQNEELERSRKVLEEKTQQLELSGQYKSEFMSTMSHELRTPLNSILILSDNLAENEGNRLSEKQVEHAKVIHKAGGDLLELINDILDLAKVEEGKLELILDDINLEQWSTEMHQLFSPVSEKNGIQFEVELDKALPEVLQTDEKRLNQILKNLLSNALKFTEQGSVRLKVAPAEPDLKLQDCPYTGDQLFAFSVIDTGTGIETEKQNLIFEAFQQSDGAISRKYGGTGLGLTISNRLAKMLGGEITVYSEGVGNGSTFTLFVPKEPPLDNFSNDETVELFTDYQAETETLANESQDNPETIEDNKAASYKFSNTLLIVEDDEQFAATLGGLAQDFGLDVVIANDGEKAIELVTLQDFKGVILDLNLPGISGIDVMEKIKAIPELVDLPIHVMSGQEGGDKALSLGAIDFLKKPASREQITTVFESIKSQGLKHLLIIEDKKSDALEQVKHLFAEQGVQMVNASSHAKAIKTLSQNKFDCIIFDLDLVHKKKNPQAAIDALVALQEAMPEPIPLIIYTGNEVDREHEAQLRKYSDRVILKTNTSQDRLISEVSLFLHWLGDEQGGSQGGREAVSREAHFEGKRVLVVDDDMRNVYSLTSELEERGMLVEAAASGVECMEMLQSETSTFDIVLMDIMMPELDGFSTIEQIRNEQRFNDLPIIVLTAKSLKEDQARCKELGANDYLLKPIDINRLIALMRVWMT